MLFLVEIDHVKSGALLTPEQGRAFIRQIIEPTLARAEELAVEKKVVAGGAVVGRIALRFMVEADTLPEVDRIVSGLPLWPLAETRVTPLVAVGDRRKSVHALVQQLSVPSSEG